MFTKTWLLDTLERMARTFLQAALGPLVVAAAVNGLSITVLQAAASGGVGAALALLLAVVSAPTGQGAGMLVDAEPKA